jgi:hypothetical protein
MGCCLSKSNYDEYEEALKCYAASKEQPSSPAGEQQQKQLEVNQLQHSSAADAAAQTAIPSPPKHHDSVSATDVATAPAAGAPAASLAGAALAGGCSTAADAPLTPDFEAKVMQRVRVSCPTCNRSSSCLLPARAMRTNTTADRGVGICKDTTSLRSLCVQPAEDWCSNLIMPLQVPASSRHNTVDCRADIQMLALLCALRTAPRKYHSCGLTRLMEQQQHPKAMCQGSCCCCHCRFAQSCNACLPNCLWPAFAT